MATCTLYYPKGGTFTTPLPHRYNPQNPIVHGVVSSLVIAPVPCPCTAQAALKLASTFLLRNWMDMQVSGCSSTSRALLVPAPLRSFTAAAARKAAGRTGAASPLDLFFPLQQLAASCPLWSAFACSLTRSPAARGPPHDHDRGSFPPDLLSSPEHPTPLEPYAHDPAPERGAGGAWPPPKQPQQQRVPPLVAFRLLSLPSFNVKTRARLFAQLFRAERP